MEIVAVFEITGLRGDYMCRKLSLEVVRNITNQFYSHFCGVNISEVEQGIHFVCSAERDAELRGFGCKYTLFILVKDGLCIVSYSPKYNEYIDELKEYNTDEIIAAVNHKYKMKKMQLMTFNKEVVKQYGDAKILRETHYPLYETFFRATTPNANPDGWLYEYFIEKTAKEYFVGYISNDKLVSVCDAPDMPYMEDEIQHTGISTLKEERRKGYAKYTAALAAHHLIENGVCPQWECHANNIASIELAKSIGYQEYGVAYILEE